jgi:hypothetical protein
MPSNQDPKKFKRYRESNEEYREREMERSKQRYASLTDEQRESRRIKDKEAKRLKREQPSALQGTSSAYGSSQALGKAIVKVENALPVDQRKQVEVLIAVCTRRNLHVSVKSENHPQPQQEPEINQTICSFFQRDDVSRQAPGLRDVKINWSSPTRMRQQKRHLLMTVKEAYAVSINKFK